MGHGVCLHEADVSVKSRFLGAALSTINAFNLMDGENATLL